MKCTGGKREDREVRSEEKSRENKREVERERQSKKERTKMKTSGTNLSPNTPYKKPKCL